MAKLTWDVLDKLKSADEIADLLRKEGIKGTYGSCPLIVATGDGVGISFRLTIKPHKFLIWKWESPERTNLTKAERDFVHDYDRGVYSDLFKGD